MDCFLLYQKIEPVKGTHSIKRSLTTILLALFLCASFSALSQETEIISVGQFLHHLYRLP
jgi:hypothetical protein